MKSSKVAVLLVIVLSVVAAPRIVGAQSAERYVAGGTVVVKDSSAPPRVDSGVVVCSHGSQAGVGGACVPFGAATDSILVQDDVSGTAMAFQVCIDNDGDGVCTSPDFKPCGDDVFFSHGDGKFFNPLGPLPTSFRGGCAGGSFPGYVVFLCEGVHADAASGAHVHPATTGSVTGTRGGTGFGDFCGGARENPSRKSYIVLQ